MSGSLPLLPDGQGPHLPRILLPSLSRTHMAFSSVALLVLFIEAHGM